MGRCVALFGLLALICTSATAFISRAPSVVSTTSPYSQSVSLQRHVVTRLQGKLWDRLEIEEDEEPYWYLLNCIAGLEMDLLRQCRTKCADMPDAIKFVVPTEVKTRSHGANRMVTETKTKYQGYVFAKLRLCPEVYDAIQELDLCRSWMGTVNRQGHKKLPPAPVALNELEVENFGLEDEEFEEPDDEEEDADAIIVDSGDEKDVKDPVDQEALKVYLGLKVEDMVKVTKQGKFFKEDGIVRRLKDGKIFVRFYTYGTMFEEWLDPGDVRKLSGEEILKGLSGPSQPVTQRDFDGPKEREGDWGERRGGLRQNLMSNVKGAGGPRNRRSDRPFRDDNRDMFGRTDEDKRREEHNWKWYQENRDKQQDRAPASGQVDDEWNFRAGSRPNRDDGPDAALRDVDSQWGRQSQRQQRKGQRQQTSPQTRRVESAVDGKDDWSAFVSPAQSPARSDEDAFFASLMSDLSDDLDSSEAEDSGSRQRGYTPKPKKGQNEEDFFSSLMSELAQDTDSAKGGYSQPAVTDSAGGDDDFFAALEAELGGYESKGSSSDDSDDFFAKLEAEMNTKSSEKPKSDSKDSDAFPDFDVSDFMESDKSTGVSVNKEEVQKSAMPQRTKVTASDSSPVSPGGSASDLGRHTVPQLKEMLRERGLKVSGKKSELIDRLKQGQN